MICAVKGYNCILVMPDKMSSEKHNTMARLGAKVVRTPKDVLHTAVAQKIHEEIPNSIILDQVGLILLNLIKFHRVELLKLKNCDTPEYFIMIFQYSKHKKPTFQICLFWNNMKTL